MALSLAEIVSGHHRYTKALTNLVYTSAIYIPFKEVGLFSWTYNIFLTASISGQYDWSCEYTVRQPSGLGLEQTSQFYYRLMALGAVCPSSPDGWRVRVGSV